MWVPGGIPGRSMSLGDTLLGGQGGLERSTRPERKRESEILFDGLAYRKEEIFLKKYLQKSELN